VPASKEEINLEEIEIREDSIIARIAAAKLGSKQVAIVIGNTIHLYNTRKSDFLANRRWVRHELAHVRQFQHHGFIPFIFKYLLESIKKGYYKNKYEAEAREAENGS
jgi:hypothetical protein